MTDPRRAIPPVERLLDSDAFALLQGRYPRARVLEGLRQELAKARDRAANGASDDLSDPEPFARAV